MLVLYDPLAEDCCPDLFIKQNGPNKSHKEYNYKPTSPGSLSANNEGEDQHNQPRREVARLHLRFGQHTSQLYIALTAFLSPFIEPQGIM
jgi:hypothetical protein